MFVPDEKNVLRKLNWTRTFSLFFATSLMILSGYSAMRWIGAVGAVSGWTGLPQYSDRAQRLALESEWWRGLALVLPFAAALVLGLGVRRQAVKDCEPAPTHSAESQTRLLSFVVYLGWLGASYLGTLVFVLCFTLIGFVLTKFRMY